MKFKIGIIIVFLIALAVFFRWQLIKDNHFLFYFDQARDAYFSRSIIEKKDLKIQGPSASGTNDTVYHGVLYYYLIGPVYTLFGGNPASATFFLIFLNSLTIIPIYLLTKNISKSKFAGCLASFLYAFSIDAAQAGSWLSNPSLTSSVMPWLYLFIWKVFFDRKPKYLLFLALTLGITHQSAIYSLYTLACVAIFYFYKAYYENRILLFNGKQLIKSLLIYLLAVSSILLTQFKLFKAGIFTLQNISQELQKETEFFSTVSKILGSYVQKFSFALFPSLMVFSFFVFTTIFICFFIQKSFKKSKFFLLIWLFGPLWLFGLSFRNSYHNLIGILPAILIITSLCLFQLAKSKIGKIPVLIFLLLFAVSNTAVLKQDRKQEFNHLSVQRGAYLNQQLALIDQTYKIANGQKFSISVFGIPYAYSTTWAYLYSWYGSKKYGYTPLWFGPSQEGIPAGELLSKSGKQLDLHFIIYEPGLSDFLREKFEQTQNGLPKESVVQNNFGTLILRQKGGH